MTDETPIAEIIPPTDTSVPAVLAPPQDGDDGYRLPSDKPLRVHPLLRQLIPPMSHADYARLKADIAENGLLEPITVTSDNEIIAGEARQLACEETGMNRRYVVFDGDESLLVSFIISSDCMRRHMTVEQLALIGAKLSTLHKGRPRKSVPVGTYWTIERAAGTLHVSRRSILRAKLVLDKGDPKIIQALENQEISLAMAEEIASRTKTQQWRILKDADRLGLSINESLARWRTSEYRFTSTANIEKRDGFRLIYANPWAPPIQGVAQVELFDRLHSLAAKQCALFIVARAAEMERALVIAKANGFRLYSALALLHKPINDVLPLTPRSLPHGDQFMLLLWFTAGNAKPTSQKDMPQILRFNREDDNEIIAVLEALYPDSNGARLDLLGHRPKRGWCLGEAEAVAAEDDDADEVAQPKPKVRGVFPEDLAARARVAGLVRSSGMTS